MTVNRIRIATRKSALAIWQAEHVRECLRKSHPGIKIEITGITTEGDRIIDTPLYKAGGKGLFIKELEQALLDGTADIAVHSIKDVTVDLPEGLALPVVLPRDDPRDVFISNTHGRLLDLPEKASVGTSSLRRQCLLHALRPDLDVRVLRGNVNTRLRKLDEGTLDAIILAAAGVNRLDITDRVREYLDVDVMLPAIGQGAIGIESRIKDQKILEKIIVLDDQNTHLQITAERIVSKRLYGGCHLPIAAYARIDENRMCLKAMVGKVDGSRIISDNITGPATEAETLGNKLADRLFEKGAEEILREVINEQEFNR